MRDTFVQTFKDKSDESGISAAGNYEGDKTKFKSDKFSVRFNLRFLLLLSSSETLVTNLEIYSIINLYHFLFVKVKFVRKRHVP